MDQDSVISHGVNKDKLKLDLAKNATQSVRSSLRQLSNVTSPNGSRRLSRHTSGSQADADDLNEKLNDV